jgi:hypothetical protein
VPDWDSTERSDSDEDAAWRDLIARFDSPATAQEPAPWPEREDMPPAGTTAGQPAQAAIISTSPVSQPSPPRAAQPVPDPPEEHFVPPPPPPLPKLDPLTKGAWVALFGGPGYLLVGTVAGWSMPGIAVFCAIAAFVAGVALLVFRLNDDHDDPDDNGAVV